jgi:type IV fimbrial biogenesis protein FimT
VNLPPVPVSAPARSGRRPRARSRGHSLTQFLATLAITGAVAGGAPAMQHLVHEQRLTAHVNQLFGDLHLARSEAIRRAAAVTLCKSSTGLACSSRANWQDGWLLFADGNENGQLDAGEPAIRVQQTLPAGTSLRFGAFGPGSGRYVTYLATGFARQNGTFTFCDSRGVSRARAVILSNSGRPRIDGKNSSGGALSCP